MFGFLGNIACSIDRDISEANLQQSFYIRQCKPFYKSGHPVQDRETGDIYFTFVKKYGSTSSLFNQFILFDRPYSDIFLLTYIRVLLQGLYC